MQRAVPVQDQRRGVHAGRDPGMDVDEVSTGSVCGRTGFQMDAGVAALSRCRRTIVVVRQFSLVAISRIHPPAGILRGWARAIVCDPSRAR